MVKKYAKKITAIMAAVTIIFSMLLYFPSGTFSNISFGLKASAAEITVSQPKVGDGTSDSPYQIRTAAELYWFAGLVNGTLEGVDRNASASAVLTADITVNSNLLNSLNDDGTVPDGTAVTSWTPINNFSLGEAGTFDGQNHTISGLYFNDTSTSNVGLFGVNKGTIKNVGVVDSYFRGKNCVGGVCGENDDTITNCYNTGTVSGSDKVGGVCGYNCFGTITNCYNTETVSGSDSVGGVCGYNYGKITNCYYDSNKYSGNAVGSDKGTVTGVNGKTTAQFNSGEVAYLLSQGCTIGETTYDGSIWGQEIGTDPYPVLGGAKVYGYYEPSTDDNGVYQIGTVAQLYWFADKVNNDNENFGSASAVLTADITVNTGVLKSDGTLADDTSGFTSWTPIGNIDNMYANMYAGTFDGQNHTISGLYCNISTGSAGLFGYSRGTVKNVGVVDSYFSGNARVGGVCGRNENGTITNCYNSGEVSGEYYVGGVCGVNNAGNIIDCYNTGAVSGDRYVGGVCGGCNYSDFLSTGTITNCYYDSNKYSGNAVGCDDEGTVTDVEGKTTAQFNSGEVAYHLSQGTNGEIWGQEIGTDPYPVLNGKKVLANVDCSAFANDIIVYGQSASLDGTIGFNIYVSADDSYEWDKTVNGVQGVEIENGLYKFTYQVAAKDMDKKINFTVNDKIDVTVSVSDYLTVLSETDNAFLKNLADYMSVYGDAAEAYFSGETVAEQTVTDDLSVYDFTVGTMPEGISYYGSSLILKSETTIRHYFKLAEGKEISDYTFSVDGMTVTPTEKQGYYCIDIKNVRAEKLGTSFNVSVNGEEVITNYSALSYVYKVMESDSTDDNLKNLVKALYIYNRNALTYINAA